MTDAPPPRPAPPRGRRQHLGFFLLVIAACVGIALAIVLPELGRMRDVVAREDAARARLEQIRETELRYRERTGRFGWIGELEKAGLLAGMVVRETDGVHWVASPGYRVDVLLPHARLGPGVVAIAPEDAEEPPDPDLLQRHFAVVARPLRPGVDGFRAWYVDEGGEVYLNEGVVDDEGAARNELPTTQVTGSMGLDTASYLLWQKASDIPPLGD